MAAAVEGEIDTAQANRAGNRGWRATRNLLRRVPFTLTLLGIMLACAAGSGAWRHSLAGTGLLRQVGSPQAGAVVLFLGTTRQFTAGRETASLDYECYADMARRKLEELETREARPGLRMAGKGPGDEHVRDRRGKAGWRQGQDHGLRAAVVGARSAWGGFIR